MTLALQDKVAVITGGNSGVGFGIAQEFVTQGAAVVITGRNQETLDSSVEQLGGKTSARRADASSPAEMDDLLRAVSAEYGRLDIFVANAGIGEHAPLGKITEAQFDKVVNTNFKGVVPARRRKSVSVGGWPGGSARSATSPRSPPAGAGS